MQIEFGFKALSDDIRIFEPAERRVVVTPDECLIGETSLPSNEHFSSRFYRDDLPYQGDGYGWHDGELVDLGVCRKCKKGTVYRIVISEESKENMAVFNGKCPDAFLRCTYCK